MNSKDSQMGLILKLVFCYKIMQFTMNHFKLAKDANTIYIIKIIFFIFIF